MGILTSLSLEEVRARGSIKDADVLRLRRAFNDDHTICADEAEALMALNEACPIKEPSWGAFYVEALTDYVVFQAKPEGYVVADNAKWLIERISRDGHVDSHTELELLVNVLDKARWSPPSLAEFAITQVKHAVVTGAGPLRSGQPLEPGAITPSEVTLLRRILYAFGGDGSVAVTRIEADALIAINRCIEPGKSPAVWTDLFVKAVGNAVLAGLGHVVPSREDALRAETSLEEIDMRDGYEILQDSFGRHAEGASARDRIGGFFSRMIAGSTSAWASMRAQSPEERALSRLERQRLEIIANERIDEIEEAWLIERFGGERPLDDNETALLAFLQHEASTLPESIRALTSKATVAA